MPITSISQLVTLEPAALDFLYQSAPAAVLPPGKLRGRAIVFPGTALASPASAVARLAWQGKVIYPGGTRAVNRFFGLRMVKAQVYPGPSWLDGNPSLILDYKNTSWVYARYRDEIREVGPGIYLGLMFARTKPAPTFKTYFALEAPR